MKPVVRRSVPIGWDKTRHPGRSGLTPICSVSGLSWRLVTDSDRKISILMGYGV
jgi:hypothetical protein